MSAGIWWIKKEAQRQRRNLPNVSHSSEEQGPQSILVIIWVIFEARDFFMLHDTPILWLLHLNEQNS